MAPPSLSRGLKRKRGAPVSSKPRKARPGPSKLRGDDDSDIVSQASREEDTGFGLDDIDLRRPDDEDGSSGDEDENETPAQKRLRLATLYLENVKSDLAAQQEGTFDAAEIDRELIQARLKQDVVQQSGKLHDRVADRVSSEQSSLRFLKVRGHRLPVTSAVASQDGTALFTAGKEGHIIKWDLRTGKQIAFFPKQRQEKTDVKGKGKARIPIGEDVNGHVDEVLSLALSDDGHYLASGGRDRRIGFWEAKEGRWLRGLGGHKDAITGVTFRKGSSQLYSASLDRTVKSWDAAVLAYVETMFGHQDGITSIDALRAETAVSSGGRDTTVRFWKIIDETYLVFRGGGRSRLREVLEGGMEDAEQSEKGKGSYIEGSLECVAMVDESTFLSGGDSGTISLWSTTKKKPLFKQPLAHGLNEMLSSTEGPLRTPRWITSLASLRYSDLFASGSWDGRIRLWKISEDVRSFAPVAEVQAPGFVNSLQLLSPPWTTIQEAEWAREEQPAGQARVNGVPKNDQRRAIVLVAALGQEPRMGRWMRIKGPKAQNATLVVPLRLTGVISP
ncbi:WD40 repeat-like protein [Dacryopinax primogenitus]|uniref:WD40 repeat-like protein n=1 Tax=Dacryopinax primogenitus (strain DJM 731) TaxID=1858805 RepID=M5G0E9_DACPD|nr:WD40 repeat-like protein [Dacryopinax primogenitus]EJU01615.1 WD40 repeat-like protein [Dacryopinax primogenitus]